jgi:nucleotide-binding universal stress UspA family protein
MFAEARAKKSANNEHDPQDWPEEESQVQVQGLSVLLAFDGSPHALAAIDLVNDLFAPCVQNQTCTLTAMTVMPTQYIGGHEEMQASLNQLQQRLEQVGLNVTTILRAGNPAASLNAYAEEIQANLIVIGARGRRSAFGILLGGVAQQVVEYSTCPVLVVRAPYRKVQHVLALTDGSPHSQHMIEYLAPHCPQAEKGERRRCSWLPAGAQMTIMHILPPPISPESASRAWALGPEALYPAPIAPIDVVELHKGEVAHGEHILAEAQAIFTAASLPARIIMKEGDAAEEIMQYIEENEVDLIACGSRGLGTVTGWLLGSVSRKLVHYADRSILIVK